MENIHKDYTYGVFNNTSNCTSSYYKVFQGLKKEHLTLETSKSYGAGP